jgi:1-acyl-sn-glycerol-3-phosphate acyltransferase
MMGVRVHSPLSDPFGCIILPPRRRQVSHSMGSTDTDAHDPALATDTTARPDRYYWRLFATGFCFVVFGVSALAIGTVVLPIARWLPGSTQHQRKRARSIIQWAFRAFARLMLATDAMSLELVGIERLGQPGQLVIANHPTLIDAILVLGFMPTLTNCVMKEALRRHPLTRSAALAAGYVSNAPTDQMIAGAAAALESGECLVIFPEGTRTRPGEPMSFHRGAANIALRAARSMTPVFITCEPSMLSKSDPWYRIPSRRVQMRIRVGADIDLLPHQSSSIPIGSRSLNRELQKLFEQELSIY